MATRLVLFLILFIFFFLPHHIHAAKPRPKVQKSYGGFCQSYSSARLSRTTNSIAVSFGNLGLVKRISYELSYTANGILQGAMGSIAIHGQAIDSRDLYFGTCSHGVCTPHYNIRNATLLISTLTKQRSVCTKRYRIKI